MAVVLMRRSHGLGGRRWNLPWGLVGDALRADGLDVPGRAGTLEMRDAAGHRDSPWVVDIHPATPPVMWEVMVILRW